MKKVILNASIFVVTGVATFTSCDANTSKNETRSGKPTEAFYSDAEEKLADQEGDYVADLEAYRLLTSQEIKENEQRIADFKAKVEEEKAEAQAEHRKEIAEIEAKNAALKAEIKEYKPKGKAHWKSFKNEFGHDIRELGKAIKSIGRNDVK